MTASNYRTIETPFFGQVAADILNAVSGQMSDGLWENSRGYEKYWTNFNVTRHSDNRVVFHVSKDSGNTWCNRWYGNPFRDMSDAEFLAWYAGKLKAVIQAEARDNRWTKGWWNRDNTEQKTIYLNYKEEVTVAAVYCVYDWLLGLQDRSSAAVHNLCFGNAADAETIAKREEIAAKKAKILEEYNARIAEIEKNYKLEKEAAGDAYRAAMTALQNVA